MKISSSCGVSHQSLRPLCGVRGLHGLLRVRGNRCVRIWAERGWLEPVAGHSGRLLIRTKIKMANWTCSMMVFFQRNEEFLKSVPDHGHLSL